VATLKDVARESGLGIGTVSRALSGHPRVSPDTRRLVEETAKRIGYQSNALARALRRSESKAIGLVIPDLENEFYMSGAAILQDILTAQGYLLVLCCSTNDPTTDGNLLASLAERRVDGIAHVPCSPEGSSAIRALNPRLPVVEYARRSASDAVDSVTGDERRGVEAVVDHLAGLGHTSIAMIAGPPGLSTTDDRAGGFESACRRLRLRKRDCPVLHGPYGIGWGREAITRILRDHPDVTAVFASSSQLAMGALEALRGVGVGVPGDMSLVGFLNPEWFDVASPPLTTYDLPLKDMGGMAAQLLLQRIREGADSAAREPRTVRIEGRMVIRESTAAPRAGRPPGQHQFLRHRCRYDGNAGCPATV
jgi:LacI family transcriptional regulator